MPEQKAQAPVVPGSSTMSVAEELFAANVNRYLELKGWRRDPPGIAGSLWHHDQVTIAVPEALTLDSREWAGLVERLAAVERRPSQDVAMSVATQYVDVTRLHADDEHAPFGAIALAAGVKLVHSAQVMLRAAGTTARRPRASIDGSYSERGDELVSHALMAHTEAGSYVVPIWLPLSPPDTEVQQPGLLDEHPVEERLAYEPAERRVSRTLAQSLEAIQKTIVQPASEPTNTSDLLPLIAAGGSRELVTAVEAILAERTVTRFAADFQWAGGLAAPGGVAATVEIEAEAAPRLARAAQLLKIRSTQPAQLVYTGKIVLLRHREDEPFGIIGIDTVRNNRTCEIWIRIDPETLDRAYEWARTSRTVMVEGTVERTGRRLQIAQPVRVMPLDELFSVEAGS